MTMLSEVRPHTISVVQTVEKEVQVLHLIANLKYKGVDYETDTYYDPQYNRVVMLYKQANTTDDWCEIDTFATDFEDVAAFALHALRQALMHYLKV